MLLDFGCVGRGQDLVLMWLHFAWSLLFYCYGIGCISLCFAARNVDLISTDFACLWGCVLFRFDWTWVWLMSYVCFIVALVWSDAWAEVGILFIVDLIWLYFCLMTCSCSLACGVVCGAENRDNETIRFHPKQKPSSNRWAGGFCFIRSLVCFLDFAVLLLS